MSEEITLDEKKKAVYSSYVKYMMIPSSSVYYHSLLIEMKSRAKKSEGYNKLKEEFKLWPS